LEKPIRFFEHAKNRLVGKLDSIFICQIAQAKKRFQLGQYHDSFETLNKVTKRAWIIILTLISRSTLILAFHLLLTIEGRKTTKTSIKAVFSS